MQKSGKFALLFLLIQTINATPQSFSQSFSSSSFTGPGGQTFQSSVYQDSQGNRVINGVPYRPAVAARPVAVAARPVAVAARPVATAPVYRPVATASRPAAAPVYTTRATARPVQYQTTRKPASG